MQVNLTYRNTELGH